MENPLRYLSITLAVAACLIMLGACQKSQSSDESAKQSVVKVVDHDDLSVSREQLISTLESKNFDRTISVMNEIKAMQYQGNLLVLLKNIWEGNFADVPQIDKAFVEHPRIRIEIADVLLQASLNDRGFNLEPKPYINYARGLVNSVDSEVAVQAILVVGVAHDPQDVPLLEKILKDEKISTFRAAAIAYTKNCAVTQEDAESLTSSIKSEEFRSYLSSVWSDMRVKNNFLCSKI